MQRWWSKLRSLAVLHPSSSFLKRQPQLPSHNHLNHRLVHSSAPNLLIKSLIAPSMISPSTLPVPTTFNRASSPVLSFMQVRHITLKQRKRKLKSRRPPTPAVSKVKKTKIKPPSCFKGRFIPMKNGQIRRWKEGRRHNAHSKSQKQKRRLRLPAVVPAAYAKVMKKLNFRG